MGYTMQSIICLQEVTSIDCSPLKGFEKGTRRDPMNLRPMRHLERPCEERFTGRKSWVKGRIESSKDVRRVPVVTPNCKKKCEE
eukprot:CCRYP_011317-RA/>CCRYP_011317-RA protein AED:0.44 eAED:0.44 QI:239/1/1/1/0/0/2/81/83